MIQTLSSAAGLRFAALAFLGSLVLAASAQAAVPLWPVPMTLQSLAVLLLGALGGARLGAASVALYLAEGALGMPVFANGQGGLAALAGPTAGFLLGFLPAAALAGLAARGPWWRQGGALLAAHLVLFVPGVLWLAGFVGLERAFWAGFVLFIPGTLVKVALALATLRALPRR
ncbi:biotin transporter BioY [Roseococcus sp. DSY-14]|uniref:biotin transporter BioY n=1 Tax=Roseococcus sp. DSY-14 TaxID=3369650 RepID=UPI00387A9259